MESIFENEICNNHECCLWHGAVNIAVDGAASFFGNIADLGNIDGIQLECFNEINRNYIYPMDMVILTTSQGQGESKIAWKFIKNVFYWKWTTFIYKYLLKKVSKSNTHFIKLWCYLFFSERINEYEINIFKFSI